MSDAPAAADTGATPPAQTDTAAADAATATDATTQTPPAAAEPGKGEETWRDSLPDNLRQNPTLNKFSSVEALANAHVNAVGMIGKDKVVLPQSPDDADGWSEVYKAIGRPDEPAGYEFAAPEGAPEGFDYPQETVEAYRQMAHEAGLSVTQAQKLHDWFVGQSVAGVTAQGQADAARQAEVEAALQQEWGNATGQKVDQAKQTMRALMGKDFADMLEETGLGNNVAMIKGFANLAPKIKADETLAGFGTVTELTPAEMDAHIAEYRGKFAQALNDKFHPEHKLRVDGLTALYNKKHAA